MDAAATRAIGYQIFDFVDVMPSSVYRSTLPRRSGSMPVCAAC